tara:strand:- start:9274 stop:9861 length:588 start_codon:yes stop_codon:yes gene_type:complete
MPKYGLLDPGTCLPVLEAVCHVFDIDDAIEFGCGLWSTSTLARSCKNVTSVENVQEWIDKMKIEQSHRTNLTFVHYTKPMNTYLKENDSYDLIFIDGEDRIACLQEAFGKSAIIICHDTHAPDQNWEQVNVPASYRMLTYTACHPYLTTIFYHKDVDVRGTLFDRRNYSHKNTYVDEEFWIDIDICEWHRNNKSK